MAEYQRDFTSNMNPWGNVTSSAVSNVMSESQQWCLFCKTSSENIHCLQSTTEYVPTLDIIQEPLEMNDFMQKSDEHSGDIIRRGPHKPKIFKPVLLYHSWKEERGEQSNNDGSELNQTASDRRAQFPTRQHSESDSLAKCFEINYPETTHHKIEDYNGKEILSSKDESVPLPTTAGNEFCKNSYHFKCSPNEVIDSSVSCCPLFEGEALTSKFFSPSNFEESKEDKLCGRRSAFRKPCSYQTFGTYLNTCEKNILNVQWNNSEIENKNYQTYLSNLHIFPIDIQNTLRTRFWKDALGSANFFNGCSCLRSSKHLSYYFYDNYMLSLRQCTDYSNLFEAQASLRCQRTDKVTLGRSGSMSPPFHDDYKDRHPSFEARPTPEVDKKRETKQFISSYCGLACNPTGELNNNFRVHPAEKPHKCECGRAFARNEELTRHKRIHSGHRPFHCSVCGKSFGRKDHLNKVIVIKASN